MDKRVLWNREENQVSNYIKLCEEWAEKFLQMDKEELKKRFPELKEEDGYLKITHFGVPFGLRRLFPVMRKSLGRLF